MPAVPASSEGPQRVRQLIAAVNHVVPWRKPHGDALAHRVRYAEDVSREESGGDKREANDWYGKAAARQTVQRQEQAGEDQRGPHISLQKEEGDGKRDTHGGGQREFDRRNIEMPGQNRERRARFARVTQDVPGVGEISGEEKDQQQADEFHRLEAEQVYLRIAGSRPRSERDQQGRKDEAGDQRNEAEVCQTGGGNREWPARRGGRIP